MIELSKAEMEDIWNNKPAGYLKNVKAARKGMKKFVVQIQGFERIKGPAEVFTVITKTKNDAMWQAQSLLRQKHPNVMFETYTYNII
jgi:hypothetical protein